MQDVVSVVVVVINNTIPITFERTYVRTIWYIKTLISLLRNVVQVSMSVFKYVRNSETILFSTKIQILQPTKNRIEEKLKKKVVIAYLTVATRNFETVSSRRRSS